MTTGKAGATTPTESNETDTLTIPEDVYISEDICNFFKKYYCDECEDTDTCPENIRACKQFKFFLDEEARVQYEYEHNL
jgi:hypothetical protein